MVLIASHQFIQLLTSFELHLPPDQLNHVPREPHQLGDTRRLARRVKGMPDPPQLQHRLAKQVAMREQIQPVRRPVVILEVRIMERYLIRPKQRRDLRPIEFRRIKRNGRRARGPVAGTFRTVSVAPVADALGICSVVLLAIASFPRKLQSRLYRHVEWESVWRVY